MTGPDAKTKTIDRDEAWDLIPWYVNGTLDEQQRQAIETLLDLDPAFRAEVAVQRRLAAKVEALDTLDVEMERALSAMRQRIQSEKPDSRPPGGSLFSWWPRARSALVRLDMRFTLPLGAVAASILALLVVLPLTPGQDAPFRTVTTPTATISGPHLRVKAVATASETNLRALFAEHGLRIVAGPTATGVFTLEPAAPEQAEAISRALMAAPDIEFATVKDAP